MTAFGDALERGLEPVFITPSSPDRSHFQRMLLADSGVLTGGAIVTFDEYCAGVLRDAGIHPEIIGSEERLAIIRKIIAGAGALRLFAASSRHEGFLSALERLLGEIEALDVAPEDLGRALGSWSGKVERRLDLTRDLFHVYQEYRAVLADLGVIDSELAGIQAVHQVKNDREQYSGKVFILDGFKDFTPLQHAFIDAVAPGPAEMLVTLPCERGKVAYLGPLSHLERLAGKGEVEWLAARPGQGVHPSLQHVSSSLFEKDAPKVECDGAVMLLTGAGDRGQAEQVAAGILRLWRGGANLDDMAVICRSAGPEMTLISAVLEEFNIPFELPAPVSLATTALGAAVLAAIDFVSGDGDRDRLFAYLRSGFIDIPAAAIDRFDGRVRKKGIDGYDDLVTEWRFFGNNRPLDELDRLRSALAEGLAPAADEVGALALGLVSTRLAVPGPVSGADLDVESLKGIIAACRGSVRAEQVLGTAAGAASAAADRGRQLARNIAQATVRSATGVTRGCVRLLDPHRVLNQEFDYVFICGLLEKRFPSLTREDAFLSDSDRRELRAAHGVALDTHDGVLDGERFLFHRTLTRARKRAYLCYPYCNAGGEATVRSLFVSDLLDLFSDEPEERTRSINDVVFDPAAAPTSGQALRALALQGHGAGAEGRDSLVRVAGDIGLGPALAGCFERARPREAVLLEADVLAALGKRDVFRVTELETYLGCPYQYFIQSLVRPDSLAAGSMVMTGGRIAHEALCRFGELMKSARVDLSRADPAQLSEARSQMAGIVKEACSDLGNDINSEIMKVQLAFYLGEFVQREKDCHRSFAYYDFELRFGGGAYGCGGKESTDSMLNLGGCQLHGRIDRVDIEVGEKPKNRAVVIDYKTGTRAASHKQFAEQGKIQLPLYMKAVKDIFGLEPVAGEYYALLSGERGGLYREDCSGLLGAASGKCGNEKDQLDRETFAGVIAWAEEQAVSAINDIRAGRILLQPLDPKKTCEWCDYGGICRDDWSEQPGGGEDE